MNKSTRSIRSLWLLALLVSPALLAGPQGYYRWKDDKGQFQATQQPPTDRPSEFVRTSTGTSSQMAPGESADSAGAPSKAADQSAASAAKKPTGIQGVPDKDPEKCKQAQDAQAVLNSHARIREKDEKGEYRYLAPEEINEQKKLATESVDIYCDAAPPQ